MRSTLSPAFTSSKMRNMFVLISECGKHLGDFLEECIKDKNMKVEGLKIERGKYCPTITIFQTAAVIKVWHTHTHMYTQNTHTILYHSPPPRPHNTHNYYGLYNNYSASCFLNYPTSQLQFFQARLHLFLNCPISQFTLIYIKLYPFLDCPISLFPLIYIKLYPFLDCPISLFPSATGSAVSLVPFPYL